MNESPFVLRPNLPWHINAGFLSQVHKESLGRHKKIVQGEKNVFLVERNARLVFTEAMTGISTLAQLFFISPAFLAAAQKPNTRERKNSFLARLNCTFNLSLSLFFLPACNACRGLRLLLFLSLSFSLLISLRNARRGVRAHFFRQQCLVRL